MPPDATLNSSDCWSVESPTFLSAGEEEDEGELLAQERHLTEPVQDLLDKLNTLSDKMNECESRLCQMEAQKRALYADWNAQKKSLIDSIGMHSIEKTKPVFDAYEKQQLAQAAVNEATALFLQCVAECNATKQVLADTQDNSGDILRMSIEAQTQRDTLEQLNQDKMTEFNKAQSELASIRKTIGSRLIHRAWPWFEAYSNHKGAYEKIYNNINTLRSEMRALKTNYRLCMSQLESISEKVHQIRKPQDSSH